MSDKDSLIIVFSAAALELGPNPTPAALAEWVIAHPEYQSHLLAGFGMKQVGWAVDGEFRRGELYYGYYLSDKRTQEGPIFPVYGSPESVNRPDTDRSESVSRTVSGSTISPPGSGVRTTDSASSS